MQAREFVRSSSEHRYGPSRKSFDVLSVSDDKKGFHLLVHHKIWDLAVMSGTRV